MGWNKIAVVKGESNMYRHQKVWNKTESDEVIWWRRIWTGNIKQELHGHRNGKYKSYRD